MSHASCASRVGTTVTIACPVCLGMGHDGCATWSSAMTTEEMIKNRELHRCRTCNGCGRVRVEILGPVNEGASDAGQ